MLEKVSTRRGGNSGGGKKLVTQLSLELPPELIMEEKDEVNSQHFQNKISLQRLAKATRKFCPIADSNLDNQGLLSEKRLCLIFSCVLDFQAKRQVLVQRRGASIALKCIAKSCGADLITSMDYLWDAVCAFLHRIQTGDGLTPRLRFFVTPEPKIVFASSSIFETY